MNNIQTNFFKIEGKYEKKEDGYMGMSFYMLIIKNYEIRNLKTNQKKL